MSIISQELRFEKKINFYEPKEFKHQKGSGDDKDDGGLKGTALALAIVIPIIGVIIIAIVVIFICKHKGSTSDEIEKLNA